MIDPKISRKWAMPNHKTFSIPPIRDFVCQWIEKTPGTSIDPFSGGRNFATITNDLNPNLPANYHLDAEDFILKIQETIGQVSLILFDPPYSPRQISECYKGIGREVTMKDTQSAALYARVRNRMVDILPIGGVVLSFGWNSVGAGKNRGFSLEEILMVCHGGAHNDTICLAERRIK
jgi:hypothetical protein